MEQRLDLRGLIGPLGMDFILRSVLYRALSAEYGDIEVWQSERTSPGREWSYYWLVSRARGVVRGLALIRYGRGELQERIDGPFGQELWQAVPCEW
jgi:hypothetical protein